MLDFKHRTNLRSSFLKSYRIIFWNLGPVHCICAGLLCIEHENPFLASCHLSVLVLFQHILRLLNLDYCWIKLRSKPFSKRCAALKRLNKFQGNTQRLVFMRAPAVVMTTSKFEEFHNKRTCSAEVRSSGAFFFFFYSRQSFANNSLYE